jgi:hypothetical protein
MDAQRSTALDFKSTIKTEESFSGFTGNRLGGKYKFPTFIGCSEIENRGVLEDLIKESKLLIKSTESSILIRQTKEESTLRYCIKTIFPSHNIPISR